MMRRLAKTTVCHALAWARLDRWIERRRPVVLGYHRVVDDAAVDDLMPGMGIGVRMLERHLDWVGRRCRFVTLDELGVALARGRAEEPIAAVTFDDGYADVHRHAFPLLVKKGIPAALFVITDAAATGAPLLHDRLYRALKWLAAVEGDGAPEAYRATRRLIGSARPRTIADLVEEIEDEAGATLARERDDGARPLGWAELQRMQAAGMTIGSHTRSHALLVGQDADRLRAELLGSRRELEAHLGVPVRHFAYPDGQFDDAAVKAVADAGYELAFTGCRHRDAAHPLLTVRRAMLWGRSSLGALGLFSGDVLSCQTLGALPFLDRCRRRHGSLGSHASA